MFRRRLRLAGTKFRRADEVADAAHAAVVLSLRLVELHADPLTAGELCSPTEPQSAGLRDKALRLRVAQTQNSKLKQVILCILRLSAAFGLLLQSSLILPDHS